MNKTVLITGASSGIGLELAKVFARNNYNLVIVSQNEERLRAAQKEIQRENKNIKLTTVFKDLSIPNSPEELYSFTQKNSIYIDILVNNAGVQVYGNFHEVEMEDTLHLMVINMLALTKLTRLYLSDMVKRGAGKILNLASTASFQPVPLNSVYCASKAYVLHFSEGITEELKGTGVTVTTLCPGATKTNFAKRGNIENTKLFSGKLSDPADVAKIGFDALMKGKPVQIVGLYNSVLATAVRFMPRSLTTKIGMNLMKKEA